MKDAGLTDRAYPVRKFIAVVVVFSVPFIPFHFPVSFFFFLLFFFHESKAALCIVGEGNSFRINLGTPLL